MRVLKSGSVTAPERPTAVIQICHVGVNVLAAKNIVDVQFLFLKARSAGGVIDD